MNRSSLPKRGRIGVDPRLMRPCKVETVCQVPGFLSGIVGLERRLDRFSSFSNPLRTFRSSLIFVLLSTGETTFSEVFGFGSDFGTGFGFSLIGKEIFLSIISNSARILANSNFFFVCSFSDDSDEEKSSLNNPKRSQKGFDLLVIRSSFLNLQRSSRKIGFDCSRFALFRDSFSRGIPLFGPSGRGGSFIEVMEN
jgi:hypothetical protein